MKRILIIGGTSGIGWAVAKQYLEQGHQVIVSGREPGKIPQPYPPRLSSIACDICQRDQLEALFASQAEQSLDLVLIAAGFYFRDRFHPLDGATTCRMLQTNVLGLDLALTLASEHMLRQGFGHLAAIASVAGLLRDYPGASLYSATKKAVLQLCETYRIALRPFGIHVTTLVPGYVNTAKLRELNEQDVSRKPFILSEQDAAMRILRAIDQHKNMLVFPRRMHWLIRLLNCLPAAALKLRRQESVRK